MTNIVEHIAGEINVGRGEKGEKEKGRVVTDGTSELS